MVPTRIVIAELPKILENIVCQLIMKQADMVMVKACSSYEELIADAESAKPDLALIGLDEMGLSSCRFRSICMNITCNLIALDDEGKTAFLVIREPSMHKILEYIRMLAR